MALTPLPTPPSTSDPANFATRADALVAALAVMVTEINNGQVSMAGGTITSLITANEGISIPTDKTLSGAGAINITGAINGTIITGTDVTDSTSSTTGAMKTAGGLGVAKSIYAGTNVSVTAAGSDNVEGGSFVKVGLYGNIQAPAYVGSTGGVDVWSFDTSWGVSAKFRRAGVTIPGTLGVTGAVTTNGGLQTFGANDSAGAGYRTVRVPNI